MASITPPEVLSSISLLRTTTTVSAAFHHHHHLLLFHASPSPPTASRSFQLSNRLFGPRSKAVAVAAATTTLTPNTVPGKNGVYTVGEFMTRKEDLQVVKPSTTVEEALEALVEHRITGFPAIDDEWKLVGLVSDYDLLALDTISGAGRTDTNMFPEVDSTWKNCPTKVAASLIPHKGLQTFNEVQKLLSKNHGKVVGDLMTPAPMVVRELTNLEDVARLLLETKFRRLPVVDVDDKLVGIVTRGNVVRAALQIKRANERKA